MFYKFYAYGHPSILATHKTTLEFTKDKELTLKGNCIIGVNASFNLKQIKKFIQRSENKEVSIEIKAVNKKYTKAQEKVFAELNPKFCSNKEFVIRKTDFVSERTFAIKANKAAYDLNRDLISFLKEKKSKISIIINNKGK